MRLCKDRGQDVRRSVEGKESKKNGWLGCCRRRCDMALPRALRAMIDDYATAPAPALPSGHPVQTTRSTHRQNDVWTVSIPRNHLEPVYSLGVADDVVEDDWSVFFDPGGSQLCAVEEVGAEEQPRWEEKRAR